MGRETVLVVEDDGEAAARLCDILRAGGYETSRAVVEADAVAFLVTRRDCRLVVSAMGNLGSSLGEAGRTGFDLLTRLRRDHPGVDVILTNHQTDASLMRRAVALGASDLLTKPWIEGSVWMAVARTLERGYADRSAALATKHIEELATQRATQMRQLQKDLETSCELTIEAMGELLDLRDEETEGHSKRVTAYTSTLARSIGLSPEEWKTTVRGAFLHDIGKIAVPDSILLKPAALTDEEMEIMRQHCLHGYAVVRKIPALEKVAEIVYSHQEKFDGTGYPRGLRGNEIPLGARIFAVVDALDAITSDRPYRKGSSFAYAIGEIERNCGLQFDPEIVKAFLSLPRDGWKAIRDRVRQASRPSELWRSRIAVAEPTQDALHLMC